MAAKTGQKGEKQIHRIPSAVCPECATNELVAVQRIVLVGQNGGKRWQCRPKGHVIPRSATVVRLDPPKAPIIKSAAVSGGKKKKK